MALFGTGDVLVHTWDLARSASQDERLDTDEMRRLFASMKPRDEVMPRRPGSVQASRLQRAPMSGQS